MDGSRRRAILATIGSVAVAGCLDAGSESGSDDEASPASGESSVQRTESPTVTPTDEESTTPETENEESPSGESTDTDGTPDDESESPDSSETPSDGSGPPPGNQDDELFPDYDMTNVVVRSVEEETLGWVRTAIADTRDKQITGLSDTASLPEQYGMLFVYSEVEERRFVMREMDFGIDIIYADNEGVITTIHHAEKPGPDEDGSNQVYPGRGQYVLEVNYHWTTARDVTVGDSLGELPTR